MFSMPKTCHRLSGPLSAFLVAPLMLRLSSSRKIGGLVSCQNPNRRWLIAWSFLTLLQRGDHQRRHDLLLPQHRNPVHPEEGCPIVADQERADQGWSLPTGLCSQKLCHQLERHQAVLPGKETTLISFNAGTLASGWKLNCCAGRH